MPQGRWRGIPLPSIERRWSIGIYTGTDPLRLRVPSDVSNPVLTARDVTDVNARFVADPFMLRDDRGWHMFLEVFRADTHTGEIGWATSPDGFTWTYQQIVIREPFHLSYPHVFTWDSGYYMVTESLPHGEVRLYRADTFPTSWRFERALLVGAGVTDTSIVRHGDRWWLFAGMEGDAMLSVFHAESLDGPWIPHTRNPIARDARHCARPAGRMVTTGGRLFRFAQDDHLSYGRAVHAFEITTLTPTEYLEHAVTPSPVLSGSGRGWNAAGMHHIDAHEVAPGQWIACVDGFRWAGMFGYRRWPERPRQP